MDLYVAPGGKDTWSGRLPRPNAQGTDGPLAGLGGARNRIRALKDGNRIYKLRAPHDWDAALDGPVTVHLRGGRYELAEPIMLGPDDSYPVTYKAYRNETPILDGGVRIGNWREQRVNGRKAWVADLPEVAAGKWHFRQLFVNGRRAPRPRLPVNGLFRMLDVPGLKRPCGWGKGGYTQFLCRDGDVKSFHNLGDVEVVYLHFWIEERSPIAVFDPQANLVTMSRPSAAPLVGSHGSQLADYYLDNVLEALKEPGQWYLDRPRGRLYYLPRRGETLQDTEVYAPRCVQLLAVAGEPETHRFVEHVRFEGLTFRHTDWRHPAQDGAAVLGSSGAPQSVAARHWGRGGRAAANQAAADVPGVITFCGARHCAITDCIIEHVGWYGVEIGEGCHNIRITGNTIRDLGAGGIKVNGAAARDKLPHLETGQHRITDNEITRGGRIFHSAVGVLSMNAHHMVIAHNHIHDLFYTGISCGWEWGYHESASYNNRIEKNHIHDIGQGLLSDMGGIYTLGVQPGTVLRGNLIHDIRSAHYGGWCIYPDEGSSHLLIEHNVCFDADCQAFHQHYGRENMVRNNLWLLGGESVGRYSQHEPHRGFTMIRNIFVADGRPMFRSTYAPSIEPQRMISDLNLFWDLSGKVTFLFGGKKMLSFRQWQKLGLDRHSLVADPKFRNLAKRDLRLAKNSPAYQLGFEPIDVSDVGPRRKADRR